MPLIGINSGWNLGAGRIVRLLLLPLVALSNDGCLLGRLVRADVRLGSDLAVNHVLALHLEILRMVVISTRVWQTDLVVLIKSTVGLKDGGTGVRVMSERLARIVAQALIGSEDLRGRT